MSDSKKPHAGDIGVLFEITLIDPNTDSALDVSDFATIHYLFRRPDSTIVTVSGSFKTDGSDGIVQYTNSDGDNIINTHGTWVLQVRGFDSGSGKWTSDKVEFEVLPNLDS